MKKIQSQSTSNANSIAQAAAVAALNGDQGYIHQSTGVFKQRHDFVLQAMRSIEGVSCLPSQGTFYSFPDMSGLIASLAGINSDIELAEFLLERAGVALVPGSAFGAAGCMRLSYATSMENLAQSMARIKAALAAC